MKKLILIVSKLVMINLLIVGCTTSDGSNCPEALTGELSFDENEFVGTWTLTNIISEDAVDITDDNVENPSTEIFDQLPDCNKDVEYVFKIDRSFTVRQEYNATGCNNKLTLDGTWKYNNGQLTLVSDCLLQNLNINVNNEVTEFTMTDIYTFFDTNGQTIKSNVTITFEKTL